MSLLDNFAKSLSGGSKKSNTGYSSGGGSQTRTMKNYQCIHCGKRQSAYTPQTLSTNACPSRGKDNLGMREKHVWMEI